MSYKSCRLHFLISCKQIFTHPSPKPKYKSMQIPSAVHSPLTKKSVHNGLKIFFLRSFNMGRLTGHVSCALLFMVRVEILWDIKFSARAIKGAAELSSPGLRGLPAHCTVPIPFLHALLCVYFPFPFMSLIITE